jgi:hyperosmotically inducible protein
MVRVAADDYSTSPPAKTAPGTPGRTEGDHDAQPPATTGMSTEKATEAVSDTTITTKVKTKLLTTKDLKSTGIHVKTKDGIVNVSGSVPSKEQHDLALDAIRSVEGVNSVHDSLKVSSR